MDSPSIASRPPDVAVKPERSSLYAAVLALALIVYGWVLGTHMNAVAGGSDSSGYFNQARLLSAGATYAEPRTVADFTPSEDRWVYSPLGFKPARVGDKLVATYPIGLPLWIAAAAKIGGWDNAANIVLWFHAVAGIALVYAAGRTFGLSAGGAFAAAAIVGTSPIYLFIAVQTMSDVPALVWVTAAVLCAWRGERSAGWAVAAGFAFAMAVIIRPTNALALAAIAVALGIRLRPWLAFGLGGVPGAIFFCLFNRAAYGGWFTTGYGELNLAWKWVGMTVRHYVIWLPVVFSPVVVGALLLPWSGRDRRQTAWMVGLWFVAFAAFYAAYNCTHETWWYLRFLLPAAPALVFGAILGARAVLDRYPATAVRSVAIAVTIAALGWNFAWGRHWTVLHAGQEEQKYLLASRWLQQRAPANAVVACMQQSGALRFYTEFTIVRWDFLKPADFDALVAATQNQGRPLYAVLFPFELESLQAFALHMPRGHWTKIGNVNELTMWRWSPTADAG
jgi:hypothetical protein